LGSDTNRRCSRCGSPVLRRSRIRFWETPLRLIHVRPFRCRECGHRFYASVSYGPPTVHDEVGTPRESQVPSEAIGASAGGLRIGGKWMLVYGLLTCLLIGAIVSLKFGTKLQNWRSWVDRSSSVPRTTEARKELTSSETSVFKPAPASATVRSSLANIKRGQPSPRQEQNGPSSAAVAIRAERPKLPGAVQSAITSDNVVEVRVQIDSSGKVTNATAVSAKGPVAMSLENYALEAARRWRFRPAQKSGRPVGSDKVLEFLFRPLDSASAPPNESH
jgi:TonB family protein